MESISLTNSSLPDLRSFYHPIFLDNSQKPNTLFPRKRSRSASTKIYSSSREEAHDHDQDHHDEKYNRRRGFVDENMIVLRKRIHEMKMVERNYQPPSEWMEWEKKYYTKYDSIVCELMGFLQSQLMDIRPSLALGIMALIAFGVPFTSAVVFYHLIEIAKAVLGAAMG